ncbi:MAG: sigma-54-dependent Fis family transcriptional regulator [Deltaproteobacteria bacterium]|nr:sigma-54-dependent Fis family transcriptional regulator [Deltaproteobacteria bacterium]
MDQTILIIDDEKAVREVLTALLSGEGYRVTTAGNGEEALQALEEQGPGAFDYILCDIRMPKMDGLEFLKRSRGLGCTAATIVMSAYGSVDTAIEAIKLGAYDYISKPFKADEVLIALRKAEERERLIRENRELRRTLQRGYRFENIVLKSPKMQGVLDLLHRVADYRSSVLFLGESGTGKELLARTLHFNSNRKDGPFVTAHCSAIPESLLEAELFGCEGVASKEGASPKRGLFEEASGGTVFLDEAVALPSFVQVKLLALLQGGTIRRVGSDRDLSVDVRVVAATVRDPEKEIEGGRFREDLYYRLNVIPVRVPPLRERREDIPLLVDHFLRLYGTQIGKEVHAVTPEALDALLHYSWKGNVRELENVMERAVVLADGPTVQLEHLAPWILDDRRAAFVGVAPDEYSIKKVVPRIEKELITRALRKTRGNRTAASKLLEISHRAVLYKIKDYAIDGL